MSVDDSMGGLSNILTLPLQDQNGNSQIHRHTENILYYGGHWTARERGIDAHSAQSNR